MCILNDGFVALAAQHGAQLGNSRVWRAEALHHQVKRGTTFGIVTQGPARLTCQSGEFELANDMYFCVPGKFSIAGGAGLAIYVAEYEGLFLVGGPAEQSGRLRYMNGCTDTVLVGPVMLGDPCLNFLHLPALSTQASHTHPSVRIGAVLSGEGICRTEQGDYALASGSLFSIAPGTKHAFHPGDRPLRVIAFHPDSDMGPTHQDHPMLNRTLVEGKGVVHFAHLLTEPPS